VSASLRALDGKRILVVGGAGFVGSNLVRHLLEHSRPNRITVVDNLLSAEAGNVPIDPRVTLYPRSITDEKLLKQLPKDFEYVFHLSTFHGNQNSMADPLADHANNTYTTIRLYEWALQLKKLQRIVYSSAGCTIAEKTFGKARATTEDGPVGIAHDTPYQMSKIFGEFYSVYYHRQKGLPVVRARFQNVYGPGEILGAGSWRGTDATVWRNVTPTFVYRSLKGMPLTVDGKGEATRDFIYVDDIARGLALCAVVPGIEGDVFNLASGKEVSIRQLAETINKHTRSEAPIAYRPLRKWDHSGRRYGSTTKSKRLLKFSAATPLDKGIAQTVEWTTEQLPLIERNMRKHRRYMAYDPCQSQ